MKEEFYKGEEYLANFIYPDEYKSFVEVDKGSQVTSWWFLGMSEGLFEKAFDLLNKDLKSSKALVPFAKSSETNSLACFDMSGRVYLYVGEQTLQNVDWGNRFYFDSFNKWVDHFNSEGT